MRSENLSTSEMYQIIAWVGSYEFTPSEGARIIDIVKKRIRRREYSVEDRLSRIEGRLSNLEHAELINAE